MTSPLVSPRVIYTPAELQSFDGLAIPPNTEVLLSQGPATGLTFGPPQRWRWLLGSVAVDASNQLILNAATNPGAGKWVRADPFLNLQFSVNEALADAAVLFTVPAGFRLGIVRFFLEIGVAWTGGTLSAIGVSSNNAAYNTKGDLMGGSGGDVAANLASGFQGTAGTKIAATYATRPPVVLIAGNTVRWDRITDDFTAGNGVLNMACYPIF
jgi:hypothetical protein